MQCDMCGKESEKLVYAEIESTELKVCNNCARYGKNIRSLDRPKAPSKGYFNKKTEEEKIIEMILPDYASKIKNAREKRNLKQEEFAKMLNEKVSIIQNLETNKFKPSLRLAQKLEKILNITITEKVKTDELPVFKGDKDSFSGLTIGDFIKIKKRN
jgi:putative transcription factor